MLSQWRIKKTIGKGKKKFVKRLRPFAQKQLWGPRPKRGELKVVDNPLALAFSTTAQFGLVNGVATGGFDYSRIGRRIEMQYLRINACLMPVSNQNHNGPDYYRVIIFYDRQANGANPTYSQLMQSQDSTGAVTNTVFSNPNLDNSYRFQILKDSTFYVPPVDSTHWGVGAATNNANSDTSQSLKFQCFIPLKGLSTQFVGDTDGIGSIGTGSLFVCVIAANIASADVQLKGSCRLTYRDQ